MVASVSAPENELTSAASGFFLRAAAAQNLPGRRRLRGGRLVVDPDHGDDFSGKALSEVSR